MISAATPAARAEVAPCAVAPIRRPTAGPAVRRGRLLGHVGLGQVERERAPLARRADQADLAAQQPGDLAADRQAQPRAAVLPARAAVGLLERLEDDLLLVRRDADARVR